MHRFTVALALAALGLTAGQAMAQMSPADKTFATKAAQGGQAEVVLRFFIGRHVGGGYCDDVTVLAADYVGSVYRFWSGYAITC